jgi:hypothetical protein|tara:strand:+ start:1404 stop:2351 length:948 start_codon:yes stop_codon:yes gene_type:complete
MAIYTSATSIGEKEDLSDIIYRIDPTDTPLVSSMKKETTKGVYHEWQVQELAAAVDTNYASEGADFAYANPAPTVRVGNYHQISVQAASVSNTLDSVDTAGRAKETAYVKVLKGLEQKRDIAKSLYKNEALSASEPRKAGKLVTWISNASVPSDMAVAANGNGTAAADLTGTAAALTLAKIDAALLAAYTDGGNPSMLIMSPANKQNFSGLSSGSVSANQIQTTAPKEAAIVGSVSMYLSDFGTLDVTIDRQCPNSEVYCIDPDYVCLGTLAGRDFKVTDVAPGGDATRFGIVTEYTLIVKAPKAHGAVLGLNGS